MEKYKSPHGWLIILLIVFSLGVFLTATVLTSVPPKTITDTAKKEKDPPPTSVDLMPPAPPAEHLSVARNGRVLRRHDKHDVVQEAMRRLLYSFPDKLVMEPYKDDKRPPYKASEFSLHGYAVSSISVGKSVYLYDCTIVQASDHLVVRVLMELPEMRVLLRDHPAYSEYYPTINPYIHAVEATYKWGYDPATLETHNHMRLTNLKLTMVSWEDNLYRKSYEQVKNSPLYRVNVPLPLDLQKEELYDFLIATGVLNNVPMIFDPPIILVPAFQNAVHATPI